ncbi:hypothetical protein [Desmospora activa]|uniref:AAA domain-containing protein n=1 Tax=Desmospora activa DSM 45169 TaxID=1121389 RepID=A0A2T4YZQ1_9BACL|nr:hypothetical protein [Desmospora activa]PTM52723.1 hypothetical protein C8J48_3716 [Desmospora activa DSM 45169]
MEAKHIAYIGRCGVGKTIQLHRKFEEIQSLPEKYQLIFVPDQAHADYSLEGATKQIWPQDPQKLISKLIHIADTSINPVIMFIDALPEEAVLLSPLFNHPRVQVIMTTQYPNRIDEIQTENPIKMEYPERNFFTVR